MSLYSPGSTPSIEVYTDVNARVPEVDESEENVFYDAPHKKKRRSKAGSKNTECIEKKRKDSEQGGEDDERGMWFTL